MMELTGRPRGDLPALPARLPQPRDRAGARSTPTSARSRTRSSRDRSRGSSTRPRTGSTRSRRSWSRRSPADAGSDSATARPEKGKNMKRVVVFGAGLVVRAHVRYLLDHGFDVTVASRTVGKAEAILDGHPNGTPVAFDIAQRARAARRAGRRARPGGQPAAVDLPPAGGRGLPRAPASTWSPPRTSRTR